jgi:hypothetical protein
MELNKDNYFDYKVKNGIPVLSSSMLKVGIPVAGGNSMRLEAYFNKLMDKEQTPSMAFGSLVHAYCEDSSMFIIEPEWKVKPGVKLVVDRVVYLLSELDQFSNYDMLLHRDLILRVCEDLGFQPRWKPDTKMNSIKEDADVYWRWLVDAKGKKAITGTEAETILGMKDSIISNDMEIPVLKDNPDCTVKREFAIEFMIGNFPVKILLDILEINDDLKTAKITDIKTSSDKIERFINGYDYLPNISTGIIEVVYTRGDYIKYLYYIQEHLYKGGLKHYLDSIGKGDYAVSFDFAVLETKPPYLCATVNTKNHWTPIATNEISASLGFVKEWFEREKYLEF